jgi:hypothetical protein
MSTASILRIIKFLSTIHKLPSILTTDTYTSIIFISVLCWLNIGIYLWLCMVTISRIFPILIMLISNLGPRALFYVGQQRCTCGQPIELLHYYIVERHNAVLLLPWKWDTNEELTGRPMVSLRSNIAITTVRSDLAKPFCCRPLLEQAGILFKLTESTLKRHDIPCFIMPAKKGPLDPHEYLVARYGSL